MRSSKSSRFAARRERGGFTLLELMIVLAILAVIVGLVLPNLLGAQKKANIKNARIQVHSVQEAAKQYAVDHDGDYPGSIDLLTSSPGSDPKWKGPYLEGGKIPRDPWGNPIQYTFPGSKNGAEDPDIWSMGPDKQSGTPDDVGNWVSTT
jgi:general secretion pathway protein G